MILFSMLSKIPFISTLSLQVRAPNISLWSIFSAFQNSALSLENLANHFQSNSRVPEWIWWLYETSRFSLALPYCLTRSWSHNENEMQHGIPTSNRGSGFYERMPTWPSGLCNNDSISLQWRKRTPLSRLTIGKSNFQKARSLIDCPYRFLVHEWTISGNKTSWQVCNILIVQ